MSNLRPRIGVIVFLLAAFLAVLSISAPGAISHPPEILARGQLLTREHSGTSYFLYVPTSADSRSPLTVLVALRGIGDKAEAFAGGLAPEAESRGWVLVVPQTAYHPDWGKVDALKSNAQSEMPWLNSLLRSLAGETSLKLRDRVLLYGFSRGAQSAHRFALGYPEQVLGAALMSAGAYTLPVDCSPGSDGKTPLEFPLGVGDIKSYCGEPFDRNEVNQIAFWIGVGEEDNASGELSASFDRYIGTNRVDRAISFAKAMADLGARTELRLFPNLAHQESAESRAVAFDFLKRTELESIQAGRPNQQPVSY